MKKKPAKKPVKRVRKTFKTPASAVQQTLPEETKPDIAEEAIKAAEADQLKQICMQTRELPLKSMLKVIESYLEGAHDWRNAKRLWDVMSALRGPDEKEKQNLKGCTTTVIRYTALGYAARNHGADTYVDIPEFAAQRKKEAFDLTAAMDGSSHFMRHVANAFRALDLSWGDANKH